MSAKSMLELLIAHGRKVTLITEDRVTSYNGQEEVLMWKKYRKNTITEIRPYQLGEDLTGIDVSDIAKANGSPQYGDFIARDPAKPQDQWLLTNEYVAENYVVVE